MTIPVLNEAGSTEREKNQRINLLIRQLAAAIADGSITTAKLADNAVTYAKIQNVSATDVVLGRKSAGSGVIEEIACTAAGRAMIAAANAAAQTALLNAATSSAAGIVELATAAETAAGSDATRALSPASFLGAGSSVAASGYYTLPGGVIIQWGQVGAATTGTATFPVTFPNAVWSITFGQVNSDRITTTTSRSASSFNYSNTIASTGGASVNNGTYIAIGH